MKEFLIVLYTHLLDEQGSQYEIELTEKHLVTIFKLPIGENFQSIVQGFAFHRSKERLIKELEEASTSVAPNYIHPAIPLINIFLSIYYLMDDFDECIIEEFYQSECDLLTSLNIQRNEHSLKCLNDILDDKLSFHELITQIQPL